MSTEQTLLVAVQRTDSVCELVRDIVSAARRAETAEPGDRSEVVRYEALCVRLETLAEQAVTAGAQHLVLRAPLPSEPPGLCFDDGSAQLTTGLRARLPNDLRATIERWMPTALVVEVRRGLDVGPRTVHATSTRAPDPAEAWSAEGGVSGTRAVEQRFRSQCEAILAAPDDKANVRGAAINPSGINNRVITQVLRQYVARGAVGRVDAPVEYRDGSRASYPFPLRSLNLVDDLPATPPDQELHLALLSIRHTEMDPVVDGSWLRNAEVSRPRPAALTDDFVYETSRTQLTYLTDEGRRSLRLYMYQTGLDTAVVGFLRAVTDHLLQHPRSLSVVPMFYASSAAGGPADFQKGKPWTIGGHR